MTGDPYILVFSRITMECPSHSASSMGTSTYYIIQFGGCSSYEIVEISELSEKSEGTRVLYYYDA